MKKFLLILLFVSFIIPAEIGRYQVSTTTAESKKGTIYVIETIIDTKTGKIVKRKKISLSKYKLPYKDRNGRMVKED
jgi:hypothetical protein